MIDIKKYEGHTPAPWIVGYPNCESFPENAVFIDGGTPISEGYDGRWSWSPFFSTTSSGKEISKELGITLRHRLEGDGEFDGGNTPLADVLLMADAPLLLEAYLKESAEVKRLREAIADIADEMEQVVCTEYEQEIIEDLRKVIE